MRPSDLHVELDSFAGPFDLLCTILLRRELPLADVPLVEIVVEYVQQLAAEDQIEPDTAAEFVLLLAALLEIKSRELLASDEVLEITEQAPLEAQDEMFARLLRYATFKNAAAWIAARGSVHRYWRVASRPTIRRRETYSGPVMDPAPLQRSIQVLLAQPDVDVRHLVGKHASVHEMTQRLLHLVRRRDQCSFDEAVGECSRLDQAVAFVAMLELAKNGYIAIEQQEAFGRIQLQPRAASEQRPAEDAAFAAAVDAGTESSEEVQIA